MSKDAKGHGSEKRGAAHQIAIDQLGHSPLTSGGVISNNVRDAYRGDVHGTIEATFGGFRIGKIDYASGGNQTSIHMIETEPGYRRTGIASQMMDRLKAEFPGRVVKWGSTTPEGEAFKRAYYRGKK